MTVAPTRYWSVFALAMVLALGACGDDDAGPLEGNGQGTQTEWVPVPGSPWARVTEAQVDEAKAMGVPVAIENAWGMRFVYIPKGKFLMGSPEGEAGRNWDETQHEVGISIGYYMQTRPVVESELPLEVRGPERRFRHDRHWVAWRGMKHEDARKLARVLSEADDTWQYRLPTEAEWEYACRAGSTTAYYWGDEVPEDAAKRATNPWGVTGMHRGTEEWCIDRYEVLPSWTVTDPHGPAKGDHYVVRGASNSSHGLPLTAGDAGGVEPPARSAQRGKWPIDKANPLAGVRLVIPVGYGLGKYGATPVTFVLVDEKAEPGAEPPKPIYDLRIIRMNDRLRARVETVDPAWVRLVKPKSPLTLTMVPGAYYVYAEGTRGGKIVRGKEMKFFVEAEEMAQIVPIPEKNTKRYGSGAREKPQ